MHYRPVPADTTFLLDQVLKAPGQWQGLPPFGEFDADLLHQVLDEAARFTGDVVAPLTVAGDAVGCRFEAGRVTTPPGFRAAYQAFWRAGWPALACAPEDGGQGLPWVLDGVLYEWLSAANHGWTMAPGLLHGAYECLKNHGSAELQQRYLAKIASGEWLATMCLTEPHAGSDLGLARTRAVLHADGSYRISGTKIFISGGEHDLTDNIVHLVLGRLPDAPAGPKGLSLFLVPKLLPDGSHAGAHCDRIEEKMGLHGSPTCVMRFDSATGWIIGEPGRGLNAMFVMMNAARLHVALQGVGLLDAAWQKARAYAAERRQMRAPGPRQSTEPADLIEGHPAIRRILDTQRAWIDGARVLAYQTGIELDNIRHHADSQRRAQAQSWCALLTPVLKAMCTHQAFHGASECLQVFGGHGYVREWGIEQVVRDSRVSMIYEGTNEIQAIDLLVRKVLADDGRSLAALLDDLAGQNPDDQASRAGAVALRFASVRAATADLVQVCRGDPGAACWVADDYLRLLGLAMMDWAWSRIEAASGADQERWAAPARAFARWILPEFDMRLSIIQRHIRSSSLPAGA
jgi:alkylation response protein AidB-like acyl-CoA dehydrogenase